MSYSDLLKHLANRVITITIAQGHPVAATILIELIGAIVESDRASREQLTLLKVKLDSIVSADARTGNELLNRAFETSNYGRSSEAILDDVRAAMHYFTRALSFAQNRMEEAVLRHRIAVCAFAVGDSALAKRELVHARAAAVAWKSALVVPSKLKEEYDYYTDKLKRWDDPKTIGDHINRFFIMDTVSGIGNLLMWAGMSKKDLENAQAEVDQKKKEADVLILHMDEVASGTA